MTWRVATRPGKATLEVIDPDDWDAISNEQQQTYQLVNEFPTEQEADKFAVGQLIRALAVRPKTPRKVRVVSQQVAGASAAL